MKKFYTKFIGVLTKLFICQKSWKINVTAMKEDYKYPPRFSSDEVWRLFPLVELAEIVSSLVNLILMLLTTKLTKTC